MHLVIGILTLALAMDPAMVHKLASIPLGCGLEAHEEHS